MATTVTYNYSGTNTTASGESVELTALALKSNYAKKQDDAGVCVITNKTCPNDQQEVVRLSCRPIPKVGANAVKNVHPPKVNDAVLLTIDLQTLLRETTTTGDGAQFVTDYPVEAWLNVKVPVQGPWVNPMSVGGPSYLAYIVNRLHSCCYDDAGNERFSDLLKGGIIPDYN